MLVRPPQALGQPWPGQRSGEPVTLIDAGRLLAGMLAWRLADLAQAMVLSAAGRDGGQTVGLMILAASAGRASTRPMDLFLGPTRSRRAG